jgi:hypothetical protein
MVSRPARIFLLPSRKTCLTIVPALDDVRRQTGELDALAPILATSDF